MSILLIRPNDQKAVYGDTMKYVACEPPYWMGLIAAYCMRGGAEVETLDAEAYNLSFDDVSKFVSESKANWVGIIVTGTNLSASTQKMQGAELTSKAIREKNPDKRIFFWGLHPSALPERTLKENDIDCVIKGEGFESILKMALDGAIDLSVLNDIYYKNKIGEIKKTTPTQLTSTDELPMPAWEMLPMEKYVPHNWHIMGEDKPETTRGRYGVISTSIGCPFNCSFCAISAQFGLRKLRFWNVDRVINEIDRLVNEYNVKYIKILDECFVLKKDYVEEFCDKLIGRGYDLNIWGYARIDTVDPEILKKLRKAGVRWLALGIESGDDETLAAVDKGQFTSAQTVQVLEWCKENDIYVIANFMFGLPDDTKETMMKTLTLAKQINPEWINFFITMPYPGSRDYFTLLEKGQIKNDSWIQYSQYSYESIPMGSKYLTPKEVLEFRDWAFVEFFNNNDCYFNMIRDKFGQQYVDYICEMTKTKLRRKLLE